MSILKVIVLKTTNAGHSLTHEATSEDIHLCTSCDANVYLSFLC